MLLIRELRIKSSANLYWHMHGSVARLSTYSSEASVSMTPKEEWSRWRSLLREARLVLVSCTCLGAEKTQQMEKTQMASPQLRHHPDKVGTSYTPTALQSPM